MDGEQEKDAMAEKSYIEQREGVYRVGDTRVSLDSIVYAFLEGHTAESIQQSFPILTLEQVYGAITYYLAHREGIDAYLQEQSAAFETFEFIPLSFWYDAPLISQDCDRRHDP